MLHILNTQICEGYCELSQKSVSCEVVGFFFLCLHLCLSHKQFDLLMRCTWIVLEIAKFGSDILYDLVFGCWNEQIILMN